MVSACLLCLIVTLRILKKLSIICISKAQKQNDLSLNCDFSGEKVLNYNSKSCKNHFSAFC